MTRNNLCIISISLLWNNARFLWLSFTSSSMSSWFKDVFTSNVINLFFNCSWNHYRVAQQCCPGGNRLRGYLRIYIFWLNNRYFKPKFFKKKMKKKILKTLAGFVSDLANLTEKPLGGVSRGSPDDFRRDIIAGPHGTSWTNWWIDNTYIECMCEFGFYCFYSTYSRFSN